MAIGVLISSFPYVGLPVVDAQFGYYKAPSSLTIQRLQLSAQTAPAGGNVTVTLIDQSGNTIAGATVTLAAGTRGFDQPLVSPIVLSNGGIVSAKITETDIGIASDLVLNLIGATSQGAQPPNGGCGPCSPECPPPSAQMLFFAGSVQTEVAQAQAAAAAAAASATEAEASETATAASAAAAAGSATSAATSATNAAAQVTLAAGWATNANNAAAASAVYASQSLASATTAAASATAAAASAAVAAAGQPGALLRLTAASTQTIPDATPTAVTWDSIQYDDLSFWSGGNPSRITIPAGVTRVRITGGIRWTASGTGERKLKVRSNGGTYEANSIWGSDDRPSDASGDATITSPILEVTAGQYFELIVEQNSGGGLDIDASTAAGNHANFFCVEVINRIP